MPHIGTKRYRNVKVNRPKLAKNMAYATENIITRRKNFSLNQILALETIYLLALLFISARDSYQ